MSGGERTPEEKPKVKKVVEGAYDLSLGISIVVAVLIGIGLGYWMRKLFGYEWLFWLGVFWGVGGAILNIYKAYRKQVIRMNPSFWEQFPPTPTGPITNFAPPCPQQRPSMAVRRTCASA